MDMTAKVYSFVWNKAEKLRPPSRLHFDAMQEVITTDIVRGDIGIEVGSGCGYDIYKMGIYNPNIKIIGMDISEGIYIAKILTGRLKNIALVKGSAINLPFKADLFSFAYSFGVLHHMDSPVSGLMEIVRILKKNSPMFLYLYEDHSENRIKYFAIKIINLIRRITTKIPPKTLYFICYLASPCIVMLFTYPSIFLKRFSLTKRLSEKMPFNFGTTLFSLTIDLYDRFAAPVEHRFSRKEVYQLFCQCGLFNITITRLNSTAGWVAWGFKS